MDHIIADFFDRQVAQLDAILVSDAIDQHGV
jgi:hypothetical protein